MKFCFIAIVLIIFLEIKNEKNIKKNFFLRNSNLVFFSKNKFNSKIIKIFLFFFIQIKKENWLCLKIFDLKQISLKKFQMFHVLMRFCSITKGKKNRKKHFFD